MSLTTEEISAAPVGGSRLDDIKDVLAWEAIALLYVLVVPVHALLQQYFAYRRNRDAKQSSGSVQRGGKRFPAIDARAFRGRVDAVVG